jgi:hypothetical protein
MEEFYRGFAQRARDMAEKADPFTRRRLLGSGQEVRGQGQSFRKHAATAHHPALDALRRLRRSMTKGLH